MQDDFEDVAEKDESHRDHLDQETYVWLEIREVRT
jgi:hypothetical protein